MVELKLALDKILVRIAASLNRTMVELKFATQAPPEAAEGS